MKTRELLAALMEKNGENPYSLSIKLKNAVKQPQIYRFVTGIAREPRRSTMQPIADHYGIPVEAFYDEQLAGRHLVAIKSGTALSPSPLFEKSDNVSPVPAFRMVPVLNTVNAGMYKEIVDTHPDDLEYTPVLGPIKRYTFALRVEGDSMAPAFKHGAVVIVDPDMPPKPKDCVIAVNGDNEATFKQLVKDGPDWYLKPLNNAYPIKPLGDAQIIGVVMALQVFSFRGDDTWPV